MSMSIEFLDKIVFVMHKIHSEENAPIRMDWKDLRFKDEPSDAEFKYISAMAMERHGLHVGKIPISRDRNEHRTMAFVLNDEQLKASGGFTMSEEQLFDIHTMLDKDPKETAQFLIQKAQGKLKGTPEN